MLLSITTLAIADIIEEADSCRGETELNSRWKVKTASGDLRKELMLSLQTLGDYESLLVPPSCVISAANQAASKAAMFVSGINISSGYMENVNDRTTNYCMWLLLKHFLLKYTYNFIIDNLTCISLNINLVSILISWKHATFDCGVMYLKELVGHISLLLAWLY